MAVTEFHGDRQIRNGTIAKADLTSTLQDEIDDKVVGPPSSNVNAIAVFDGTTGKLVKSSDGILTSGASNELTVEEITTTTISPFLGSLTVDGRDVSVDGSKLDGIEAGATANQTDAHLLARANHTGTQPMSTISDAGDLATKDTISGVNSAGSVAINKSTTENGALDVDGDIYSNGEKVAVGETSYMVGNFTANTSGNRAVTGLGFKPKAIEFICNATTTANARMSVGFTDGTNQVASASVNTAGTKNITNGCVLALNSDGSTDAVRASIVSMDEDGFTLNFSQNSSAYAVLWKAQG